MIAEGGTKKFQLLRTANGSEMAGYQMSDAMRAVAARCRTPSQVSMRSQVTAEAENQRRERVYREIR